ncbi:energy transducer TonB [Oxalobacter aliiformigenes]|uniref:energy transducer TonB n=1 Tax=Oxalobacter aliiformigenes TaxID=2946593 RepID=UPI0022B00EEC|nr:energy transducer TonB [Oxalobacter aliiformigenes]WAV88564.1 energy transducer TonB [Oxalobacter aliiformigenes]
MEKADNPFRKPRQIRFMSREGWISLAAVLSVHLFLAGWIGWGNDGGVPEMAAPMTGMLLAGDGGGGNGGGSGGQAGKKAGTGKMLPKEVTDVSGKTATGLSGQTGKKKATGSHGGDMDRMPASKPAMPDRKTSSVVSPEKTDDAAGSTGVSGGKSGEDGGGNPFGGVSAYGDGHGNGGDGNGSGYGYGGTGRGNGSGNGSGDFSGPYGGAGSSGNPKPPYPAVSRRMGEEGVVVLSVMIEADGTVSDVKLKHSSGFPRLDASALKTVRHWRYVPARKNGRPVAFRYVQPIRFSLDD